MEQALSYLQTGATSVTGILIALQTAMAVLGLVTVGYNVNEFMRNSRAGQPQRMVTFMGLVVGSFLFSLENLMQITSVSIFGISTDHTMLESYTPLANSDPTRAALHALVFYINGLGWFLISRGLWEFYTGPKYRNQGWVAKAFSLMFLAACCTNFYLLVDVASQSFGGASVGTEYFKFSY